MKIEDIKLGKTYRYVCKGLNFNFTAISKDEDCNGTVFSVKIEIGKVREGILHTGGKCSVYKDDEKNISQGLTFK